MLTAAGRVPKVPENVSRNVEYLAVAGDAVGSAAQTIAEVGSLELKRAPGADSLVRAPPEALELRKAAALVADTSGAKAGVVGSGIVGDIGVETLKNQATPRSRGEL